DSLPISRHVVSSSLLASVTSACDETVAPIAEANGTDASESDADESTHAEVTEASNEEETT
ncbi:MAG: hypothetical protein AAFQ52_10045, partial [Chloroflexota bacterium]